jgi:hypothetical protein
MNHIVSHTRSARSLLASLMLGGGLVFSGCASPPAPPAERYQAPPLNSMWTYLLRSSGSFGDLRTEIGVRVEEQVFEGRRVLAFESAGQRQLQDRNGALIAVTDLQGRVQQRYDPPLGFDFPLSVGKTWTRNHTVTLAGNPRPVPFKATWTVEAYENISVPAGRFATWRLRYSDSFGESDTVWSSPESLGIVLKRVSERPAGYSPGGAGSRTMELQNLPR